jgi:hypothetical protein
VVNKYSVGVPGWARTAFSILDKDLEKCPLVYGESLGTRLASLNILSFHDFELGEIRPLSSSEAEDILDTYNFSYPRGFRQEVLKNNG